MTAQPTVHIRILAELDGNEIFELGAAVLNRENYSTEIAALLRAAATEVEQEKPQ